MPFAIDPSRQCLCLRSQAILTVARGSAAAPTASVRFILPVDPLVPDDQRHRGDGTTHLHVCNGR